MTYHREGRQRLLLTCCKLQMAIAPIPACPDSSEWRVLRRMPVATLGASQGAGRRAAGVLTRRLHMVQVRLAGRGGRGQVLLEVRADLAGGQRRAGQHPAQRQ